MRKLFILSCITLNVFANVNNEMTIEDKSYLIKEYQEMFYRISQKRVGLDDNQINQVKQPFIQIVKKKKSKGIIKTTGQKFVLEAILGNRVMINGKWYKLYEKIGDFKIVSIYGDNVILSGNGKKQKLTIRTKNENITIK